MIKTFGSKLAVEFQVLSSQVYEVPTHWVGRSVPCAGEDCPMCPIRQPRQMYFVGLRCDRASGVFEIPSSVAHAINVAWQQVGGSELAGVVLLARRVGARAEWIGSECRRSQLLSAKVHQQQVAAAVAELYKLQTPMLAETFVEWFERVRVGQAATLGRSVLPFGGKSSAHQIA